MSKKQATKNRITKSSSIEKKTKSLLNNSGDSSKSKSEMDQQVNINNISNNNSNNNNQNQSISSIKQQHKLIKNEINKYVLWKRPIQTIYYFICELILILIEYIKEAFNYKKTLLAIILLILTITIGFQTEGQHLKLLLLIRKQVIWYLYWVGLGVASSIGLGTGLHTFLLYLGPFIAKVTLAAYECKSVNFPEPPYPNEIICPNNTDNGIFDDKLINDISIWSIMSKVRIESFMWGLGTALGELPPYFMARASALSSSKDNKKKNDDDLMDSDEEEIEELEELLNSENKNKSLSLMQKIRLYVFKMINKAGFIGILLCASIPNPLFDLAGITCGHFLVNFSTFFGATLIGKAVIKMHIQKLFVIGLFSEHHVDKCVEYLGFVPFIGKRLQPIFSEFFNNEKNKLHASNANATTLNNQQQQQQGSVLSWLLEKFVFCFILYFVISIVNSLAQRHYKRKAIKSLKQASD